MKIIQNFKKQLDEMQWGKISLLIIAAAIIGFILGAIIF